MSCRSRPQPSSFSLDRFGALRHDFNKHPLLQLSQLAEFAKRLMPTRQCRFAPPGMIQTSAFRHTPKFPKGSSIEHVFTRLDMTEVPYLPMGAGRRCRFPLV